MKLELKKHLLMQNKKARILWVMGFVISFLLQGSVLPVDDTSFFGKPLLATSPLAVQLVNCPVWGRCAEKPKLTFSLPFETGGPSGTTIHVRLGAAERTFQGWSYTVELPLTTKDGLQVTYWTSNALGQASEKRSFFMRCLLTDGVGGKYLVELLGKQWEAEAPGCAAVWNTFPDLASEGYGWQQRLEDPIQLQTKYKFPLLAGRLIWSGLVDASSCLNKGLLSNGSADACGQSLAQTSVERWQNENNAAILQAARQAYIPTRLLKGLIAQESQFWPHWEKKDEYGLGMLTDLGVDMALQWNYGFYYDKCTSFYSEPYCSQGYQYLSTTAQKFLRGRLLSEIGTLAEYRLLAETLYAGCLQSAQLVRNIAKKEPREVASYEDMWRITLGVYHAGCGCVHDAMQQSWKTSKNFYWANINRHLSGVCQGAGDYFDRIIRLS